MTKALFLEPEHDLLRDQIRRFVTEEIQPHADAWEEAGRPDRALKIYTAVMDEALAPPGANSSAAMLLGINSSIGLSALEKHGEMGRYH